MIYFDNAATTKVYDETAELAARLSKEEYFNPSALYPEAARVSKAVNNARKNMLESMKADGEGELYFLSGGTEADNTALFCTKKQRGSRIIVSEGEHDAVINAANALKGQGYDVVFAPIKEDGSVDVLKFAELLNDKVSLVSIMHVSNETGVINDLKKLIKLTRKYAPNAIFHSDGVQAFCKINVNIRSLGIDLYTISGHKIHAPKGIGALYVKKGVSIKPLIYGGGQEKGFRSGTENVPAILAFEDAAKRNLISFKQNYSKKREIIEYMANEFVKELPETVIITPIAGVENTLRNENFVPDNDSGIDESSAPHILTVAFSGIRGEVLLHALEKYGICVGIGSACSSHRESRFKNLLGLDSDHKDGIVRFSVSEFNTLKEAEYVADIVEKEVAALKKYARK